MYSFHISFTPYLIIGADLCHQSIIELQNTNNNACTAAESTKSSSANAKQPTQPEQRGKSLETKDTIKDKKEDKIIDTEIKVMSLTDTNTVEDDKQTTTSAVKSNDMSKQSTKESTEIRPDHIKSKARSFQEKNSVLSSKSVRSASAERGEDTCRVFQNNLSTFSSHGKITHSVTSRFGMKTFTVVPPKPSVMHAATGKPAVTLTAGAIKIDDQGNMVKVSSSESGINCSEKSPIHGKAKAFWSSNERQENVVPYRKGLIDRAKENLDGLKSTPTEMSETTLKTSTAEYHRTKQNTQCKSPERAQAKEMLKEEGKEPVKDIHIAKEERVEVGNKISLSRNVQLSNKPALPPPLFPDLKRDLSFLKPSRRTSSQYVASAISKYTPKTSVKTNSISNVPESSASKKTHTTGFQRSVRSMQVNPHQSSQDARFASKPNPMRSMSYPECVPDNHMDFREVRLDKDGFQNCVGSTKVNAELLEIESAKNNHIQCSGSIQINENANNDRDNKYGPKSPTLAQSNLLCSSAKAPPASKGSSQGQTSVSKVSLNKSCSCTSPCPNYSTSCLQDMRDTRTTLHITADVKPLPSVTLSDSGVKPGPLPVTVFGPVKKFRPVICGPIEKETSLHSSLMEAIQTGGGRDRLKKVRPR